jgi:biopolymer transport protein ExbD
MDMAVTPSCANQDSTVPPEQQQTPVRVSIAQMNSLSWGRQLVPQTTTSSEISTTMVFFLKEKFLISSLPIQTDLDGVPNIKVKCGLI